MHELHLMAQVVKAVEHELHKAGNTKLLAVRLKVSPLSHLLTHDDSSLQTAFALAARGTKAEGATLEIISVPGDAWCPECRNVTGIMGLDDTCSACGGSMVAASAVPEVVLHELVVE